MDHKIAPLQFADCNEPSLTITFFKLQFEPNFHDVCIYNELCSAALSCTYHVITPVRCKIYIRLFHFETEKMPGHIFCSSVDSA